MAGIRYRVFLADFVKSCLGPGIEFEKYDEEPNRAWVSGIFKDGSAFKNGEVEAGDFLFSVTLGIVDHWQCVIVRGLAWKCCV